MVWILMIAFVFPNGDVFNVTHKDTKSSLVACNQIWLEPDFRNQVLAYGDIAGATVRWKCIQEEGI
jgi:hypothetical protein